MLGLQNLRLRSLLENYQNTANLTGTRAHREALHRHGKPEKAAYSAASASEAFGFAVEIMKSWMRGTISDLKREPLNTP